MPILETARLILRPFSEDDVDLLSKLMANPDFMRFSRAVSTRDNTAEFLQKLLGWQRKNRPSLFAVALRSDENGQNFIGWCGFYHQHIDGVDEIEIGYRMHPGYWNQGIATEAARAVRDHGFGELKLPRVISLISPENIPSRRVAEKIGMTFEKMTIHRELPTQVFSLARRNWVAAHGA